MELTEIKKNLTRIRIVEQNLKSVNGKLGPITIAVTPEDIKVMFLGKMALDMIKNKVRYINRLKGYKDDYNYIEDYVFTDLKASIDIYADKFDEVKKLINKEVSDHPLVEKFTQIKGITGYRIALLMAMIKDISKFETASKLMVYSGLASIDGMPVNKANLNKIKEYYSTSKNKELKGFNTQLSSQVLYLIVPGMIKTKGWAYHYTRGLKERLRERCINNNEVFIATEEDVRNSKERDDDGNIIEKSKPKMQAGRYYMKGRKNFSLDSFTDKNAKRRLGRIFLHILWEEWRKMKGLPVRVPYPIDYLGHTQYIKFEDILG
jgi:hypothetical protein